MSRFDSVVEIETNRDMAVRGMTTLDEVRKRDALWRAEELEEQISDVFRDRRWLLARVDELRELLLDLNEGYLSAVHASRVNAALARLTEGKGGADV